MAAGVAPDHVWRRYAVPIAARPFRMKVGVRPSERWLLPGPDGSDQLRLKQRLLSEQRGQVLAVTDDAAPDLIAGLITLIRHEASGRFSGEGHATWGCDADAFADTAAAVQEDFCLLRRSESDGSWRLVAGCVCFPSHWRLADKMGKDLDAIHGPVPEYAKRIAVATRMFFDRASAKQSGGEGGASTVWERFNWILTATDELFCPESASPKVITAGDVGRQLWLRTERQTVRRLPCSADAVVFTIRTFLTPLVELTVDERQALAVALAGLSPELARYRGSLGYREVVQQWARSQEPM